MLRFARVLLAVGAVGLAAATVAVAGEKHFIGHSWDLLSARPADVAQNLDAWEAVPLDGISLALSKEPEPGLTVSYGSIMTDPRWNRDWFDDDVQTLRQCASGRLKHNFLTTFWAPRQRLAWDDDEAWANFAHNLGVVASIARAGGAVGILIDPEDYPSTRQYVLLPSDGSFELASQRARARGAQLMQSMAAEFPDITLLSFWMLSLNPQYYRTDDPQRAVAEAGDLWPAFLNGFLDALPPGARLVDGNENAYRYEAARNDFYLAAWQVQNKALALVAPENHAKYQTQVLTGFGLYLDAYVNPADSPWYFGPLHGSRLNHLQVNFSQALDAASRYVWVYGEKHDWINWTGIPNREPKSTWNDVLPGFHDTLDQIANPRAWATRALQSRGEAGTLENLLESPDLSLPDDARASTPDSFLPGVLPPGWWSWQLETGPQGTFGTDSQVDADPNAPQPAALAAQGVPSGCFGTSIKTEPGRRYLVEVRHLGPGASVHVAWKRNGSWDWSIPSVPVFSVDPPATDTWRHAYGLVDVPGNVDEFVLMLNVKHGDNPNLRTWFDQPGVYLASPPPAD